MACSFVGGGAVIRERRRSVGGRDIAPYRCCQQSRESQWEVQLRRMARHLAAGAAALVAAGVVGSPVPGRRLQAVEAALPLKEYVAQHVGLAKNGMLLEKLKQVPVFAITDSEGRPFLAEVDNVQEGEQASVFFFSYEDAEQVLEKLKKKGPAMTKNAEINVLTMDYAYKKAKGKALPSGIKNDRGHEILVVFRFYADTREVKEAQKLLKKEGVSEDLLPRLPVFLAQGLTIGLGKDFVVPLYFSKEDLDQTWENVRKKTPDMPKSPPVHVVDLVKVLEGMENNTLSNVGLFPSRKSIERVRVMHKEPKLEEAAVNK